MTAYDQTIVDYLHKDEHGPNLSMQEIRAFAVSLIQHEPKAVAFIKRKDTSPSVNCFYVLYDDGTIQVGWPA